MGLKMNIAKTKVMLVDNTPINENNVLIENVQGYVYLGQHYSLKENNQDKEIQRIIMAGWAAYAKHRDIFKSNLFICLKKQVYNSCVPASYDIWCRDLDIDQTSTEQTCGSTYQSGKKYAQHHIQRKKDQHLGPGEDISHRYNVHFVHGENNEMVLGRAYQPPQRQPMDLACHHLETI